MTPWPGKGKMPCTSGSWATTVCMLDAQTEASDMASAISSAGSTTGSAGSVGSGGSAVVGLTMRGPCHTSLAGGVLLAPEAVAPEKFSAARVRACEGAWLRLANMCSVPCVSGSGCSLQTSPGGLPGGDSAQLLMLVVWLLTDAAEDLLPTKTVLASCDASEEQSAELPRKMWPTSGREVRSVPLAAISESEVILHRL